MTDTTETRPGPGTIAATSKDSATMMMLRIAGLICLGLGIVGAFVPLMPTTCFLILAACCFAKSAPQWRRRILAHPRFGRPVRTFLEEGALSRRAKALSVLGIGANYVLTLWLADLTTGAALTVGAILAVVAFYILTRPEPARLTATTQLTG